MSDTGETFHLGGFLAGMAGQCRDLADFLVCLSNGIGARPLRCQRSTYTADSDNAFNAGEPMFETKPITVAPYGGGGGATRTWYFHQWTNDTNVPDGSIFDACVRFGGTYTPEDEEGPDTDTPYYGDLVNALLPTPPGWPPGWGWRQWSPLTPFVPTIAD